MWHHSFAVTKGVTSLHSFVLRQFSLNKYEILQPIWTEFFNPVFDLTLNLQKSMRYKAEYLGHKTAAWPSVSEADCTENNCRFKSCDWGSYKALHHLTSYSCIEGFFKSIYEQTWISCSKKSLIDEWSMWRNLEQGHSLQVLSVFWSVFSGNTVVVIRNLWNMPAVCVWLSVYETMIVKLTVHGFQYSLFLFSFNSCHITKIPRQLVPLKSLPYICCNYSL